VNRRHTTSFAIMAICVAASLAFPARAENFTAATKKLLAEAKLPDSIMAGLDKELAVPAALVEAAKKEGKVSVRLQMSDREFAKVFDVFKARYPGIEHEYVRGIGRARAVAPLVAYKKGTVLSDVLSAYESVLPEWRKMDGLVKINDLPAYSGLREEMKTEAGTDAADKMNYWCTIYSPERVKKENLPKTWDDLLTMKQWRNGRLGAASNAAHTWIPMLWGVYGDEWTRHYLHEMFQVVKPQLRKETLAAFGKLIAVGEFDMGFAVQPYVTARDAKKGVPVASHCPEPVPVTWGYLGVVKGTKHLNAARLFLNWYISKEGQIANYEYATQVPVRADLAKREFLPYPDEVLGKKLALRTEHLILTSGKVVGWFNQEWQQAGGKGGR
jgi:iron(III) transport system substrate-binding protein